jgi:hypothetical protein
MKTLNTALCKGILISLLLILLSPSVSEARQQHASIEELKEQIARLEEIDRNPATSAEVKGINQTFIASRRAELRGLLERRRDALRNYLAANARVLRADEVRKVEDSIRGLESELNGFSGGSNPEASRIINANFTPPSDTTPQPSSASSDGERSFLSGNLLAQSPCPADPNALITNAVISTGRFTGNGAVGSKVELTLSVPLSLSNQPPDVTVINGTLIIPTDHFEVRLESGSLLTLKSPVMVSSGFYNTPFIGVTSTIPVSATKFKVKLLNLAYDCPSAASPSLIEQVSGSGNISTNATLLAADIEALNKANKAAAAKKSSDKNFRMGFAAAKGDGEDAQGAADISINKTFFGGAQQTGTLFDFFDQADVAFQLKKSSAEKADPRHLTLGLNLRKTFLIDSRLKSSDVGSTMSAALERRDKSKGLFRVLMIKEGLNLEGEAFDFKTVNFVSDTHFELASIAKKLGSGFYNINIFAGPELGRNMAKPDAAEVMGATADQLSRVDWIARFKAGGEFTLRLLPSAKGDNWGVELNLGYVNRHLFRDEVFTQATMKDGITTNKLVTVGRGNKAWRQADLKVFLFGDGTKRYGLKVSYNNGQLPPAFTPTKGFQFGMVVESSDDKQSGEPANNQ